jgi:pyrimidine/purine-5'-nucleotide nucleosidase
LYRIIIDDPVTVARKTLEGVEEVRAFRFKTDDAYYFNWQLHIDLSLQRPFTPSHENMRRLDLHKNQAPHLLASNSAPGLFRNCGRQRQGNRHPGHRGKGTV